METERPSALVYQLSAGGDSRCEPRCTRSRHVAANDFSPLPRTGDTGAGADMVCDSAGPGIKHCVDRQAEVYSVKQYQFNLSADFKRIIVRELPDFKERYLGDPKLDGPTGEEYTLRFSREIVVSNVAEA